jgi:hypothetical protein
MQKQNNKYMHTLTAMCLIKIENAIIIIIIKHVQNDICYMIFEKRSSSKFSCNILHPFSSFPKMKNARCICNILIPQKCCQMHFENARASHQCWE